MAGLETALALREFAGERAAVTMVAPAGRFAIPASAPGRAFGITPSVDLPLKRVVAKAGASLRATHLVGVDARRRLAMLAGGELLGFDHLVVAVGARLSAGIPEAVTFRGHADVEALRHLIEGVVSHAERGGDTALAVVVPAGCGWPLAGYEIALMAREHLIAAGHGERCRLTLVTAEQEPLAALGAHAGATVAGKLGRVGVEIVAGTEVVAFDWGRLVLSDGTVRQADRVVSLPVTRGPAVPGLPADTEGFVLADDEGRVAGAPGIRVVGDAGPCPLKKGGIACHQADAVAAAISRELGAAAPPLSYSPGQRHWWPVPKTSGRFLAPFMRAITPETRGGASGHYGPRDDLPAAAAL